MAAGVSDSQGAAGKHDTEEAPGVRCAACLPACLACHSPQPAVQQQSQVGALRLAHHPRRGGAVCRSRCRRQHGAVCMGLQQRHPRPHAHPFGVHLILQRQWCVHSETLMRGHSVSRTATLRCTLSPRLYPIETSQRSPGRPPHLCAAPLRQRSHQQAHQALQHSSIPTIQPLVQKGGRQAGASCTQRGRRAHSQARPAHTQQPQGIQNHG
jgi:hypothetical protein